MQNFFRRVSLRACEKIAEWAQAGADRLRRGGEADTEHGRDLRRLGGAASSYSSPGRGRPPASPSTVDIPEMRKLGEAPARPLPGAEDGRRPRVSTTAARGKPTTRRGAKKPSGSTEQAEHLRRGSNEHQQERKRTK
ncbi:hypothetical protein [Streptomyces triticisoli]|uniref:hypothetical protein n=1 Tax=Streptomyces triticisoli TaxID=2182797 RepID=UPI0018E50747|nr:hypothetical protein [Streptomyces triticisoli]